MERVSHQRAVGVSSAVIAACRWVGHCGVWLGARAGGSPYQLPPRQKSIRTTNEKGVMKFSLGVREAFGALENGVASTVRQCQPSEVHGCSCCLGDAGGRQP